MVADARALFGRFGVWHMGPPPPDLARALERLGYGALWVGGSPAEDLRAVEELLDATTTLTLATGIVNVWETDAATVAHSFERIESRHPGRFVLGVGIGHREANSEYRSPFGKLSAYVDELLATGVPADRLVLAALGPKALRLAAERSAWAHPYFVPTEHTRGARDVVGPAALLAPEHKVVVDPDPERARAVARRLVTGYSRLANYRNNLRRLGWSEPDLVAVTDDLIDALVAHGSPDDVARRLGGHLDAGADHVALHLLTHGDEDAVDTYTLLAGALGLGRSERRPRGG